MRCFTCNIPCKGHFCGTCAKEQNDRKLNGSVWDRKGPTEKIVISNQTVNNNVFAAKLTAALR